MTENTRMVPHTLDANGVRLHYVTWGQYNPERAVLLIHGLTNNHMVWSDFGPLLAEHGWYAIAPDLRGRGWSSKPTHGVGIPYHVNDLLALCDSLGLQRVQYVGHSLGALIGYFFTALYPQHVNRFVAIDAGGRPSPDIVDILRPVLERLGQVYPSLDAYLQSIQQASASVHPWDAYWERYYRFEADPQRDGTVTVRAAKASIQEEMLVNSTINNDLLFSVIRAPTLLLQAGQGTYQPDWFVLPAEEAARVHQIIKGSTLEVIPDGNHYTIIRSETFTRKVLDFLAADESVTTPQGS